MLSSCPGSFQGDCGPGWDTGPSGGVETVQFSVFRPIEYPNEFLGLEVEIDGEVAGTLKMFGNATKTGFLVEPGMHDVAVVHPELDCAIHTVEANPGTPVVLILTFQDRMNEKGEVETMLGWEY